MKLEQQVCSLELAKKLKELGIKQDSAFVWSVPNPEKGRSEKEKLVLGKYCEVMLCKRQSDWGEFFDTYSAFTVAELGEMLPFSVNINERSCSLECYKDGEGKWESWFECERIMIGNKFVADTEADARAAMLIYLIENDLVKI